MLNNGYLKSHVHVAVSFILEHLDVLGSHKKLFKPPPQFSRLGILVSLRPITMQFLVRNEHVCVPLFAWVGITFLPDNL